MSRRLRGVLLEKQATSRQILNRFDIDVLKGASQATLGIVSAGAAYAYVRELIDELDLWEKVALLKIGAIHPLPEQLIAELLHNCERVLVVEELEPFLEEAVRAIAQRNGVTIEIHGKGSQGIPINFELNSDRIRPTLLRLLGRPLQAASAPALTDLPHRPPVLCAGCTHRTTYYAVKSITPNTVYFANDIGCYTLGLAPPLSAVDSVLCMGSSITMASGVSIRNLQKHVAFIGDSTFFHSGIPGLMNAVHNGHELMLVILDNGTTAMTGHQPHPGHAVNGDRKSVDIETIVKALGVTNVYVVDPHDLKNTITQLEAAYKSDGVRVVISRHPCPLYAGRQAIEKNKNRFYRIDPAKCKLCGKNECHETCGLPIFPDEEILNAKQKILTPSSLLHSLSKMQRGEEPSSAPCSLKCPAGVCVSGYMAGTRSGRFKEALSLIREQVPLPGVLSRVCHQPCRQTR